MGMPQKIVNENRILGPQRTRIRHYLTTGRSRFDSVAGYVLAISNSGRDLISVLS